MPEVTTEDCGFSNVICFSDYTTKGTTDEHVARQMIDLRAGGNPLSQGNDGLILNSTLCTT